MAAGCHDDRMTYATGSMDVVSRPRLSVGMAVCIVLGVAIVSAGGVLAALLISDRQDPAVEVHGSLTLGAGEFLYVEKPTRTCYGTRGFDDVTAGAEVTVTDAAGKVLAVGRLDPGVPVVTDSRATACTLAFRVPGLHRGDGPFGLQVSHRGISHYTADELRQDVELRL